MLEDHCTALPCPALPCPALPLLYTFENMTAEKKTDNGMPYQRR